MAVVALVVWAFTVAAGVYLLVTSTRPAASDAAAPEPRPELVPEPLPVPAALAGTRAPGGAGAGAPGEAGTPGPADPKVIARTRFDPPSLARAKAEPIPGGRALAEFIHPLLGIVGFGLFVGYVMSRDWVMGAIALGIAIGTVAAGASWAVANVRAARRTPPDRYAMSFTPRLLLLHGAAAGVTVLLAALIVARV